MRKYFVIGFLLVLLTAHGQSIQVFPTHWYVGMKEPNLQLMVRGNQIGNDQVKLAPYPGVQLKKVHRVQGQNYLFLDLVLAPSVKPGNLSIRLQDGVNEQLISYPLKARTGANGKSYAQGVHSSDFIYLIMPDRFANGDTRNDRFLDMRDTAVDRNLPAIRHGGDLQGITSKLDYIKNLGVTSIWLCPVTQNDMPLEKESNGMISGYHGYWFTDLYQIDKRYGGNEAYLEMIREAHRKGLKVIQDAVYNHFGIQHFLYQDPPQPDFFNRWPTYTGSNHRDEAVFNPYTETADVKKMLDGWFTPHLPDVNQRNPFMANYLIQNLIWCTEYFGIDGWRIDTYKYCDEAFVNRANAAMEREFPKITVFGEAWANTVTGSAYYAKNNMKVQFAHNLQGVTDFPLQSAMLAAIQQPFGWTEGINRLYMTLAQDVLYQDPMKNCIFLDNHDMDRYMTMVGEDLSKYKLGIGLLLTLRGIPQMYYGTEILMKNSKAGNDGYVREDFPGGFPGDKMNKFDGNQLSEREKEAFTYVRTLAQFRKTSQALGKGKTQQYLPQDGVYAYWRTFQQERVLCVINSMEAPKTIDWQRYTQDIKAGSIGKEVVTGKSIPTNEGYTLPGKSMLIIQF
jgi:neopullulanase